MKIILPDPHVQSATVEVRWALEASDLVTNRKERQMLVVAAQADDYDSRDEIRQVVPVLDGGAFVSFRRPGKNRVFAILLGSETSKKKAKDTWLSKTNGAWISTALDCEGHNFRFEAYTQGVLEVELPKDCFALPPPAWEQKWVNALLPGKAVDQCDYRKRRMFAYSIQPFIYSLIFTVGLIVYLGRIILTAIGVFLFAYRGIDWRPILFPKSVDEWGSKPIPRKANARSLLYPKNDKGLNSGWLRVLFMPVILIPISLGIMALAYGITFRSFVSALELIGCLIGSLGLCLGFMKLCDAWERWMDRRYLAKVAQRLKDRKPPPRRVTVKLVFNGVKQQVCRPFAQ